MSTSNSRSILIVGLGLIGGSLARAIRAVGYPIKIYAYDRNRSALENALQRGWIDAASPSLAETIPQANIVVWAVPVNAICQGLADYATYFQPGQIVTDVGSVKRRIFETACSLSPGVHFIGGHPMAGKETTGIETSDPQLFVGHPWVLVPQTEPCSLEYATALADLESLISTIGAEPIRMSATEHDKSVALLSHLPQLVSACLMNTAGELVSELPTGYLLAAGGFRDTTRIAGSNPEMWRDIYLANKEELLQAIDCYEIWLTKTKNLLENHNEIAILNLLNNARQNREHL